MHTQRTRFLVVRHGETEWNVQQRYQGQLDSPLTANGLRQAEAIGQRLAGMRVDALVCSDLGRARDTAAAIARHHPGVPVHYEAALRERHFGVLGGLTREEASVLCPEVLATYVGGDPDFAPEQGESLRDLYRRATTAMNRLSARFCEGQTVVVVSHGGFIGQFMRYVLSIPLDAPRAYKFVNAAYNEFSHGAAAAAAATGAAAVVEPLPQPHDWLLHVWGDVTHLGELDSSDDLR